MILMQKKRKIGIKEWRERYLPHVTLNLVTLNSASCKWFSFSVLRTLTNGTKTFYDFPGYSITVEVGTYKSCPREATLGVSDIARLKMYKYKVQEMEGRF